ncbi:protein hairy-like [Physella acuta]|uniref:protein hairy-like n=1 Tax=Physella acuta TaxID=109671 RepID=UPI0027DD229E|nr:protein hairy-like [Physella acuta]
MTMANTTMSSPSRAGVSARKTNKPLMEKRRRARINDSLSQLKSLVIQSSKKDSSQFNKLEKADILELTVKYLRNLQSQQQQQQQMTPAGSDPSLAGKYQAGFMECAAEVMRYIGQSQGFTEDIKTRVIGHLSSCVQQATKSSFTKSMPSAPVPGHQSAQLPNGQIVQIVNGSYHQIKAHQLAASSQVQIVPSPSNLPSSTSSHAPASSNQPTDSSPYIRYTQPLHIQIPPVLSPPVQQQKLALPLQAPKDITPQPINHRLPTPQQEKIVSSSSPSPLRDSSVSPLPLRLHKQHVYYQHEEDFLPRSRSYSMTSSSSESEMTSPLNLSQSPQYYDSRKENCYSSNYSSSSREHRVPSGYAHDQISPSQYLMKDSVFSSHFPSNYTSVIVDGRKSHDSASLKYMVMEDDRHYIRHEGSTSPASSLGEERLWRPW